MSVSPNIFRRTFHLKYGKGTGTCFTIDVDKCRYIVTAKHLVEEIGNDDYIEIQQNNRWTRTKVKVVGYGNSPEDLAVLAPQSIFGDSRSFRVATTVAHTEEVYFLGYPYQFSFKADDSNDGFNAPYVKRAMVSAADSGSGELYLDGINNPGFSGGPVVRRWDKVEQIVVGIISAYHPEESRVSDIYGKRGPYKYKVNSGIIYAISLRELHGIIADNPIGIEIPEAKLQKHDHPLILDGENP